MSSTESFNPSKHTPLYKNEKNERNNPMETTTDPKTESIQIPNMTVIPIPTVCFSFYQKYKLVIFLVHHSFFNKFKVEGHELGDEGLNVVDGLAPLRQPVLILKIK